MAPGQPPVFALQKKMDAPTLCSVVWPSYSGFLDSNTRADLSLLGCQLVVVMINEKQPPSIPQRGHPTSRQLAARSAQPVNWSGRLILIAAPLGTIRVHVQHLSSLFSAFTPSGSYKTGLGLKSRRGGKFWGLKLSKEARKIPSADSDELWTRLDVRLGVLAGTWLGIAAACSLSTTLEPVLPSGPSLKRDLLCVLTEATDEAQDDGLGATVVVWEEK